MKKRSRRLDIRIGERQWIECDRLDTGSTPPINIDDELQALSPLWDALESECVKECCGIEAFGLWPHDIRKSTLLMDRPQLIAQLADCRQRLDKLPDQPLLSGHLNQMFAKQTLLALIDHIHDTLSSAD